LLYRLQLQAELDSWLDMLLADGYSKEKVVELLLQALKRIKGDNSSQQQVSREGCSKEKVVDLLLQSLERINRDNKSQWQQVSHDLRTAEGE
jgi:hypothetical protein